jgi:hypothetical protein
LTIVLSQGCVGISRRGAKISIEMPPRVLAAEHYGFKRDYRTARTRPATRFLRPPSSAHSSSASPSIESGFATVNVFVTAQSPLVDNLRCHLDEGSTL